MLKWLDVLQYARLGNPPAQQRTEKTDAQWQAQLSAEEYRITRQKGTERPNSSALCSLFEPGQYACVCCGAKLFDAEEKFQSGTGWPSFTQPIHNNAIAYHQDDSHGMSRVEVLCNSCDAHLGHVFPDGPEPSGLRYCINAVALKKITPQAATATVGGGCFWCTEALFLSVKGVTRVQSGYSGGDTLNPNYHQVCSGQTGHAEVIQIDYDPTQITYADLLRIHLSTHNPTTLNRQGADTGTQYRSIILTQSPEEEACARAVITEMQTHWDDPIVTEVTPFSVFYPAEDTHQNYYARNSSQGYCQAVINPKLAKFRQQFSPFLR